MSIKNYILSLIIMAFFTQVNAQQTLTEIVPNINDSRLILTATPFILIASDARSSGMADMGVATSPDVYSQQWNPSKYAFSLSKSGFGISYVPYLSDLVNDIFLGNITYFNKINERSAFAASLRVFSLGEFEFREDPFSDALIEKPNELAADFSYSLRLGNRFSMGIGLRYLRTDLKIQAIDESIKAAGSFGADISGYYQSAEKNYTGFNGLWRVGFAIQNLGPKIKFENSEESFLPTSLKLGLGFDFILDEYNKLALTTEFTKLLVPTPPITAAEIVFRDLNGNGVYDDSEDDLISETRIIISGKPTNVDFLSGAFQSFTDAPGGFNEELREITWSLGAEYTYQESFSFRAGYFNEAEEKGARKFFSLGAGFKYTIMYIDLSYLFSTSKIKSPLENTLRFSLSFNFGAGEYSKD